MSEGLTDDYFHSEEEIIYIDQHPALAEFGIGFINSGFENSKS